MKRRALIRNLIQGIGLVAVGPATATIAHSSREILLQESPVAGFAYYDGIFAIRSLMQGDALQLKREPENRHDEQAVEIYAGPAKLGYVPRRDNTAIAQLLDRGERLQAWITHIDSETSDVWDKLRFAVAISG